MSILTPFDLLHREFVYRERERERKRYAGEIHEWFDLASPLFFSLTDGHGDGYDFQGSIGIGVYEIDIFIPTHHGQEMRTRWVPFDVSHGIHLQDNKTYIQCTEIPDP
jgi:hypothetical protein